TDLVSGRWWRIALPAEQDARSSVRWSWSSDGQLIALATTDERLRICDAQTGRIVRELPRSERFLPATAFSPDGRTLAVESESGVLIYEVKTGKRLREIKIAYPPDVVLTNVAYRDSHHLLVVDGLAFERTLDVRTGKELTRSGHSLDVT